MICHSHKVFPRRKAIGRTVLRRRFFRIVHFKLFKQMNVARLSENVEFTFPEQLLYVQHHARKNLSSLVNSSL